MEKTDKQLLELAAKANGIFLQWTKDGTNQPIDGCDEPWNPLTDDGDALRLAVKLRLDICHECNDGTWHINVWPSSRGVGSCELEEPDPYAATRLAIVRAAAEIGSDK